MDIIDQMGFFQYFILSAFELHPLGVEMDYNKKTWNLTDKICDFVGGGGTAMLANRTLYGPSNTNLPGFSFQ